MKPVLPKVIVWWTSALVDNKLSQADHHHRLLLISSGSLMVNRKVLVKDRGHPCSLLIYNDSFRPHSAHASWLGLECLYTMKRSIQCK